MIAHSNSKLNENQFCFKARFFEANQIDSSHMQDNSDNLVEFQVRKLDRFEDERGVLSIFERLEERFFPVKRVFFISNFHVGKVRGEHGHHDCMQIVICIQGSLKLYLTFKGQSESLTLKESEFVFLPQKTWAALESLDSSTLLAVLCSDKYRAEDYFYDRHYYSLFDSNNE